ncbi:MAG: DTW domain-containing protein [Gammaproteobacteria bacterium]|nr:DTW domain-containing protein [Gammaproteobacteria bacterium]
MSRPFCYQCHRAKVTCLCGRIEKQPNEIKIIILQHPDEVNNAKGTGILVELGLLHHQKWIAEDFSKHEALIHFITVNKAETAVLYPIEDANVISKENTGLENLKFKNLIVIDATWRKAKKMWELQPLFHDMTCLRLTNEQISNYRIRKVPKDGHLSTIESVVVALRLLEGKQHAYQPLINLFTEMIDFQINRMGDDTYKKNYENKTDKK